jgi:2-C-methyl-D-erythritol 4-phosphate cytidylyltransferase
VIAVAIIAAGGEGDRFGAVGGKQLAEAAGRPVLAWTVAAFDSCSEIDSVIVVGHPDRLPEYAGAVRGGKVSAVVAGGDTRQDSVLAGLAAMPDGAEVAVVHDGARPLITCQTITSAIRELMMRTDLDGVVVGHPVFDTVKRVGEAGVVTGTADRSELWVAQTPQVFRAERLREAYRVATADGATGTDDAALVERIGGRIAMVAGPRDNIKVTVPEDLVLVGAVLRARGEGRT